jgi:hypothetical protein
MTTEASGRAYVAPNRDRAQARRRWAETKSSFLTTEFYAMIQAAIGTIIAGESNKSWDDRWVWQVAIAISYMVSRGLAKSGTAETCRPSHPMIGL